MKKNTRTPAVSNISLTQAPLKRSRRAKKVEPSLPQRPLLNMVAAWESTRPRRDALSTETVRKFNLDYTIAATVMRQAQKDVLPLRAQLTALPGFDVRVIDELGAYADAVLYAHARVQPVAVLTPKTQLGAAADGLYNKFVRWGVAFAAEGLVDVAAFEQIRQGTGWRNRAESLRALVVMYMQRWEDIRKSSTLTDEDLDQALTLSDALLAHLAGKEKTAAPSSEQVDRWRAMAVAMQAYNELQRAVCWLRWNEGDAEELTPSVYASPMSRTPKGRAVDQGEGEEKGEEGEGAPAKPAPTEEKKENEKT